MSHSGYPRNVIIRYADAMTDAPSSLNLDTHLVIDGRWKATTVRHKMIEAVEATNVALSRDRYAHPVYAMGYETKGADGEWNLHPMPYIRGRQYQCWVEVATDHPGEVVEALVIRTLGISARNLGAAIEVFQHGELAGWVRQMTPTIERRVTTGWTVYGAANDGMQDELQGTGGPAGKGRAFDECVRAIVRRYRRWA